MKRVFIIHGLEGSQESNWFPWLKTELENFDIKVTVPTMPTSAEPKLSEWLTFLQQLVGKVDAQTFFVGHSLGVIGILRLLESLPSDQKAGGAVLVAGFSESIGIKETETFFATPLDYAKVKNSVGKIVAINSDNDPYVPLERGETLRDKLGAKLIVIPNGRHIRTEDGYEQVPLVLENVLEMMGNE